MFIRPRTALLVLALIASLAHAQSPDQPVDIGIIVTPTQQRAEAVLTQLRAGWDFAVLAKENSLDSTADAGGYFGHLSPSQLQPQLRDALAGLHPGDYSPVIQTPSGFAILTVFKSPPPQADPDGKDIQAMAHSGVVRYGIDVGGMGEADALFNDASKPDGWNQDLAQVCSIRKQTLSDATKRLQQTLVAPSSDPLAQLRNHLALGQILAYQGKMEPAVEQFSQALDIAQKSVPDAVSYFHEVLGVAYLHLAEADNDAYRGSTDLDTFPPPLGAHFTKTANAQKAVDYIQQYLSEKPDDLQARWLLNLAYGILGKYPSGVPAAYLIPPSSFESKENLGRFRDIAPALGVNAFLSAGGVVVDEFQNDGTHGRRGLKLRRCQPLRFFHNNGDGTFTDHAAPAGLAGQLGGLNMIHSRLQQRWLHRYAGPAWRLGISGSGNRCCVTIATEHLPMSPGRPAWPNPPPRKPRSGRTSIMTACWIFLSAMRMGQPAFSQ